MNKELQEMVFISEKSGVMKLQNELLKMCLKKDGSITFREINAISDSVIANLKKHDKETEIATP